MKTRLVTFIISLSAAISLSAQDARSILDKASDAYSKAGSVSANFTLDTKEKGNTYSYDGKIYMKGDKFKIEIPDAITWFDGTTQWVYVKDTEEANVTNPSGEELQSISPSALFSIYKKGFKINNKGEKKLNGKSVHEIELVPQKKGGDFTKIVVSIDKLTHIFVRIVITTKTGLENILTIKNYQNITSLPDTTFRFNKNDYPNVEIIDLR